MNLLLFFLIQQNPLIQEMVNRVSADSILSHVQRLQDFVDRDCRHDSCYAAAEWIYDKFLAYGMDSIYHESIPWPPTVPDNIIGIKKGNLYSDSCYIVACAHYDAINEETQDSVAPGADDNASGVAAVLEAARILKDYQFDENIRFIAFSAEELGLFQGSSYYVYLADMRGDDIRAVYNADMIGYVDIEPESLEVFGDTFCQPLVDHFIACSDTYTNTLTRQRIGMVSDGWMFSIYGWLTVEVIEDSPEQNPYKHTPADTIGMGFNNLQFCTNSTKSIIAALASSAQPYGIAESNNSNMMTDRLSISSNPIRYTGWMHYAITDNGMVSIKLYNVAGQLLKVLVKGHKQKGNYQTSFDCRDLSQGSYILVMETNREKITRSFVAIK